MTTGFATRQAVGVDGSERLWREAAPAPRLRSSAEGQFEATRLSGWPGPEALAPPRRTLPTVRQVTRGSHLLGMAGMARDATLASTVRLAAAGDEAAFARIAACFHDDMLRVAYVVGGDWALAEDAVQAALWKAWRKLPSLREAERVRPWLVAVAANEMRQIVRHRNRSSVVEIELRPSEPGALADPTDAIGHVDLVNALRRLSSDDRDLLALRYVADLDSAEIGALRGLSASGVRNKLARLLGRLREDLDHA